MTGEDGVLGNLPNSRPGRRSAKRDGPAGAPRAGSAKAKPRVQRTTAVKGGGTEDGVRLKHDIGAKGGHDPVKTPETPGGDPLSAAVRTAAGLAIGGVKVAGAVTQELVRRLPRP
jgi:hypothetical protein